MKKRRIIIILIILLLICISFAVIHNDWQKQERSVSINKMDLEMLEKYLSDKYNKTFKISDYSFYDNGDLGINAGKHYTFTFAPIDGLNVSGSLDYLELTANNLKYVRLNITNIDKANELKSYVEKNTGLTCNIGQFEESTDDYEYFYIFLGNYDSYSISGKIYNGKEIETASDLEVSDALEEKIGIKVDEQTTFLNVLQAFKRKS